MAIVHDRLASFGMVLVVGFLLLVSLVLSAGISAFEVKGTFPGSGVVLQVREQRRLARRDHRALRVDLQVPARRTSAGGLEGHLGRRVRHLGAVHRSGSTRSASTWAGAASAPRSARPDRWCCSSSGSTTRRRSCSSAPSSPGVRAAARIAASGGRGPTRRRHAAVRRRRWARAPVHPRTRLAAVASIARPPIRRSAGRSRPSDEPRRLERLRRVALGRSRGIRGRRPRLSRRLLHGKLLALVRRYDGRSGHVLDGAGSVRLRASPGSRCSCFDVSAARPNDGGHAAIRDLPGRCRFPSPPFD